MKKIISILFGFLFLASCGGNNSEVPGVATKEFVGSGFVMQLPEKWSTSGSVDGVTSGNGELVLASVSPEKKYNFSDNIVVLVDSLNFLGTSKQYSEQNNIKTQKKYLEYANITNGALLFKDSDEGKYYVFRAKYNNSTQKLKFIQTAKVCGTKVFVLHGSMALDADANTFADIFRTFECK